MNRQVYEEASVWLVELRVGDIDPGSREKLDTWFRASPEHIRAFLELSSLWEEGADRDLDRGHSTDELIARARAAATNVVPLEPGPPTQAEVPNLQARQAEPRLPPAPDSMPLRAGGSSYVRRFGIAASLAGVAALALTLYAVRSPTYSTDTGEQRTVDLPDGSKIELNARSRIRVHYTKSERDVDLLAGQALFKVAHNQSRPFIVTSDATRVRAVGTQFDVYRRSSGTTVTVVEGRVAILPPAASSSATADAPSARQSALSESTAILLSAGEQATVTPAHVDKTPRADVAAATAWTQRELVFEATPLTEVAQEFNRYNVKPLIVSDAKLKDFHVTGIFASTNPASLLEFLRAQKNIAVEETDAGIRITQK